jgi:K+-transporting ATPase A subunit
MHNQQQHLQTKNVSKFAVIVLSIVLLTGLALVPALQLGVHAQVKQQPQQQKQVGLSRVIK